MSVWINFEKLSGNDLDIPRYATEHSAGMDFSACLTRPCKKMQPRSVCVLEIDADPWRPITSCIDTTEKFLEHIFYINNDGNRTNELITDDLRESPRLIIEPSEIVLVPLGLKCEFSNEYVLKLYIRSSIGAMGVILANCVGIIDSDYRGELFACVWNTNKFAVMIKHGQRIVQGILEHCNRAVINSNNVNETKRGEGGFGSTDT